MIAVTQIVDRAIVSKYGQIESQRGIKKGMLVLLGISKKDTEQEVDKLVKKLLSLRIFPDENEKINLNIHSISGEILLISQFTLLGNLKGNNRPDFGQAAGKELATKLYERFADKLTEAGIKINKGFFGEHMEIQVDLNGPITIILDSEKI